MLTQADLLSNLRLSAPNEQSSFDVTKELDGLIVELQGQKNQDLNVEVTIRVLQALLVLLTRTEPATLTVPLMTGFDPPGDVVYIMPQFADDPVGLRMDYDSIYDAPDA